MIMILFTLGLKLNEELILKSQPIAKGVSEQLVDEIDSTRYPSNASLLESINSNCEQQFDKFSKVIVYKIVSLNQELHKKLDELPKKHNTAQISEAKKQEYQKGHEQKIEFLKRQLNYQKAMHDDNSNKLRQLQDNSRYQYSILYSVFICLCLLFYHCAYTMHIWLFW